MIETEFFTILSTATDVQAICGTRIYPVRLPNDCPMPAIHFMKVGGTSKATQDTFGWQRYRYEVNCWASTTTGGYLAAATLRHAVTAALSNYSANGITIQFSQDIDFDDENLDQFRCTAEFYVTSNFTP